jgi:uncharacterized protein YjiS (DUF1127 family)
MDSGDRFQENYMRSIPIDKSGKPRRARLARLFPALNRRLLGLETWLADCAERARQRRTLSALPDHALKDIGLSRLDVEAECRKPCWRP